MRLLLFSDLHYDTTAARNIVEMSRDADVVIGAGDFAKDTDGLQQTIDVLAVIKGPSIVVPGNSESFEELTAACKAWPTATVLHGSGTEINGITFWGVGGAIPIPSFGRTRFDFFEDEGRQLLADCPAGAILVSHSPPKGVVDQLPDGEHRGSEAILEAVKRCHPKLVVCGHIHSSAGQSEMIGNTPIVNPGPTGYLWELPVSSKT